MKKEAKTELALSDALTNLINQKDYSLITIQDLLNESKISRSTFYKHYKTKEELLISHSQHIFNHVFNHVLQEEKTHNFSNSSFYDYNNLITHIFYHILDEKSLFVGMLNAKENTIFLNELETNITKLVDSYYNNYNFNETTIPLSLYKRILIQGFISTLLYWKENNFKETPEEMGKYYFSLFKK